ncbi:MAG: RluA family pseudouridine synthase [Treponema sp.]|nr:RluA family pseudouridine synthase [Treponema sp.]
MEFDEFTAGENDSGRRLDRVLKIMLRDFEGVNIFSALRKKLILVNGRKAEASYKVNCGDKIKIASFLLEKSPESKALDDKQQEFGTNFSLDEATVFKNGSVMVINKPYGINVQPSFSSETSLSEIVARECKKGPSLSFTPSPLHRLDRFTTGALVFSLSIDGARIFSQMMQEGLVRKTYLGIVQGLMDREFEWTDGIVEEKSSDTASFHKVRVVGLDEKASAKAVTKAFPLAAGSWNGKEVTLVKFEIPTGRKHQIRAQSAFHGFPLLGDRAYGGTRISGHEFYLHAVQIEFPSGNNLLLPPKIYVPLPPEFLNFLNSALINWKGQLII